MKARMFLGTGAVALALLTAACAGSDAPSASPTASTATTAPKQTTVTIDTFSFGPKLVRVNAGETVRWTNRDAITHTVTSGTREYDPADSGRVTATHKDGMFDSPLDGKGATASFTFTTPGTFHYFCDRHPGMEADVEVA